MNFILFNVILLFAGLPAVLIFSAGLMVCLAPMALFAKSENPPKTFVFPLIGIASIYQVYFWGFWSAFCVAMTIRFTQKPEVTWDWLYWITGFMACTSLIGWLAHKEQQGSQSLAEVRGIQKGTTLYSLIAIVAFLVFAFAPSLMLRPYGWALTSVGLAQDGSMNSVAQDEESATQKQEAMYFATLDSWVNRSGPVSEIQDTVIQTCGKLVILTVNASEKLSLITTQQEEFHFRADVCSSMTVNRVYAQPEFEKKEIVSMICDESKVSLFRKLCKRSGLR